MIINKINNMFEKEKYIFCLCLKKKKKVITGILFKSPEMISRISRRLMCFCPRYMNVITLANDMNSRSASLFISLCASHCASIINSVTTSVVVVIANGFLTAI